MVAVMGVSSAEWAGSHPAVAPVAFLGSSFGKTPSSAGRLRARIPHLRTSALARVTPSSLGHGAAQVAAGAHAELPVHRPQVVVDRPSAEEERRRDLRVCVTA